MALFGSNASKERQKKKTMKDRATKETAISNKTYGKSRINKTIYKGIAATGLEQYHPPEKTTRAPGSEEYKPTNTTGSPKYSTVNKVVVPGNIENGSKIYDKGNSVPGAKANVTSVNRPSILDSKQTPSGINRMDTKKTETKATVKPSPQAKEESDRRKWGRDQMKNARKSMGIKNY
tara:strand:- start:692 stop:1222 length:531 start_codon:yes stop_codon:yes gene_type:complete